MTKTTMGLLFLSVFLIGCMTAFVAKELIIPPLHASNINAKKWDYFCFKEDGYNVQDEKKIEESLKKAGTEGWELVTGTSRGSNQHVLYCFKRPLN